MERLERTHFPETVQEILKHRSLLGGVPKMFIELAWEEFSNDRYCAGHMEVNKERVEEFYEWLFEEV